MADVGDFSWLRLLLASTVVLGLMAALAFVLKLAAARGWTATPAGGKSRRLKIVESLTIDARRRAVILECDGHEHLLLLGPERDIVVASNLSWPAERTP